MYTLASVRGAAVDCAGMELRALLGITTSSVSLEHGWRGSLRFDATLVTDQVVAHESERR